MNTLPQSHMLGSSPGQVSCWGYVWLVKLQKTEDCESLKLHGLTFTCTTQPHVYAEPGNAAVTEKLSWAVEQGKKDLPTVPSTIQVSGSQPMSGSHRFCTPPVMLKCSPSSMHNRDVQQSQAKQAATPCPSYLCSSTTSQTGPLCHTHCRGSASAQLQERQVKYGSLRHYNASSAMRVFPVKE